MKYFKLKPKYLTALAALAFLAVPALAQASPLHFTANLTPLNDSGVTGSADLTLDKAANSLSVHITASGLEGGKSHPQHIHGLHDSDGNTVDSTSPTSAQDANSDGVIELGEGATTYGAILVPLKNDAGTFPTAAPDGTIGFTQTYDLTGDIFAGNFGKDSLFPLTFREIVLHGAFTPVAINDNLLDQSYEAGEYDPVFPVASGVIQAPGPGSLAMALTALCLLLGCVTWRRRRQTQRAATQRLAVS